MSIQRKKQRPAARQNAAVVLAPRPAAPEGPPARPSPSRPRRPSRKTLADGLVCLLLIAAVFAVFGQTAGFGFINFDDDEYVYENREVRAGLTLHGIVAAFTRPYSVNWHPLTTLTHMLDCQFYGLWPGGHHLGNVVLHALTAVALYLVLRQMTGRAARSAFAALIFAIHPLRVESVAWVAERKDVLSGLFFMLTLAAYLAYVRKPSSIFRVLLLPLVFALGLMSKPMLVTMPFVLLLLDYWPLGRFVGWTSQSVSPVRWTSESVPSDRRSPNGPGGPSCNSPFALLLEKLPLFILSACSCIITLVLQQSAMSTLQRITLPQRVANSLLACAGYLKLVFWPFGLAVYYPYPEAPPSIWLVVAATALLAGITAAAWVWRRKHPYLIVGWLWYLIMLVPVIGLVQVGMQSMADRYTYLPMIGPVVALVWLAADIAGQSATRRFAYSVAGSIAVLVLAACAAWQTSYWRDDFTLWSRTAACTADNCIARLHLGLAWQSRNNVLEAARQYEQAARLGPELPQAHYNLGCAFALLERKDAAEKEFQRAIAINPGYVKAHINLGMLLLDGGKTADARREFETALQFDPFSPSATNNLGIALAESGDYESAITLYRRAIALDPDFPDPHGNLGYALSHIGKSAEGAIELRAYLGAKPEDPLALTWLAWVLATARDDAVRNGREALELAKKADAIAHHSDPRVLDALAAAHAEAGDYPAALQTALAAQQRASASEQRELAAEIQRRIDLYRRSRPFRQ